MYGTVDQIDDRRWRLRFARTLHHPRSKVWRAVTGPEHLAQWFPTTIDGERTAGAALRFTFPGGEVEAFDGEMLVYEPEAALEFRWGPDVIRIELRDAGDGVSLGPAPCPVIRRAVRATSPTSSGPAEAAAPG